ncbi:MAG TPA: TRAP transporter small permease subunit [Kiritimatiellia bacterium]|nr:TRAP transporter small permease subunit [Kiritimatiellia bacterium]HSA19656.1 TRAP transporter small permease subunit [Kiritimatiellia bacterium]
MPRNGTRARERAGRAVAAAETFLLAVLVSALVILSAAQIVLRNFFHTGFLWAEPLLGMGLLWLTMLGALAATGARRHIVIDLVGHFCPPRLRGAIGRITALFAAAACGWLAAAGARFCQFQKEMETTRILDVPAWIYYLIVPAAFGLMALRFLFQAAGPAARPAPETAP